MNLAGPQAGASFQLVLLKPHLNVSLYLFFSHELQTRPAIARVLTCDK